MEPQLSVSGLNPPQNEEDELDKKLRNRRGVNASLASIPSGNMSGVVLPEDYGEREAREENTMPQGYNPNESNLTQHNNGEMAVAGQVSGVPVRFEPYTDPFIQQLDKDRQAVADIAADARGQAAAYHPSTIRNILATMGGIGFGALTANPMAGMSLRNDINQAPLEKKLQPMRQHEADLLLDMKNLHDISGLGATLTQRRAELTNANANAQEARTKARTESYNEEHPEQATDKVTNPQGNDAIVATPKRSGLGGSKETYSGGSKFESGQMKTEVSQDGKSVNIIDQKSGAVRNVKMPEGAQLNEQQKSDFTQYIDNFMKGSPNASPKEIDAKMNEFFSRTRPDYGAGARQAGEAKESSSEQYASTISARVEREKITDPAKAFERFNQILDQWIAANPDVAKVGKQIRDAGKTKYPSKAKSSVYAPGSIINESK